MDNGGTFTHWHGIGSANQFGHEIPAHQLFPRHLAFLHGRFRSAASPRRVILPPQGQCMSGMVCIVVHPTHFKQVQLLQLAHHAPFHHFHSSDHREINEQSETPRQHLQLAGCFVGRIVRRASLSEDSPSWKSQHVWRLLWHDLHLHVRHHRSEHDAQACIQREEERSAEERRAVKKTRKHVVENRPRVFFFFGGNNSVGAAYRIDCGTMSAATIFYEAFTDSTLSEESVAKTAYDNKLLIRVNSPALLL